MSGFFGLEIGKRAILVNQTALNIVGHNIANAGTPGYSRQTAGLKTSQPFAMPAMNSGTSIGQIGTGVDMGQIYRVRDSYLDRQYRYESTSGGYWSATQLSLSKIEVIVNEPSDNGLRSVMDQFWKSWQDLSANPENESNRAVVAQRGGAVADTFQHIHQQLIDLRDDLNANVKIDVKQINTLGSQIKDLNLQIAAIKAAGQMPNDLEDKRDALIDQLSKLVDIRVSDGENNMINIQIGGRSLVQGVLFNKLGTQDDDQGMHMVVWEDTGVRTDISGGEIMAYLDARGKTNLPSEQIPSRYKETVPEMIEQLNALAKTMIVKTNTLHTQGFSINNKTQSPDGTNFFDMPTGNVDQYIDWAKTLAVNSNIMSDPGNIAAAQQPTWDVSGNKCNFGDGRNALAIAGLKKDMNSEASAVTTVAIPVVNDAPISLAVRYGGRTYNINLSTPVYASAAQRATVIGNAINTAMGGALVTVTANGNQINISSASSMFEGISNLTVNGIGYGNYSVLMIKGATNDDFWRSVAAEMGVRAQEASRNSKNQDMLVTELENSRQSVSGVSLDEEATDMIKYQHSFNAASRYITVIDEMLDVIINRLGTVGR